MLSKNYEGKVGERVLFDREGREFLASGEQPTRPKIPIVSEDDDDLGIDDDLVIEEI
jgi:hypothetical protein